MAEITKHTPGPWRVEDGTTLVWGACNPDDTTSYGMGYPIIECRISPASHWAATKGPTASEGEANARLIAAAPDLLEALKQILSACESDCGVPSSEDGDEEPVGGGLDHEGNPDPMALTFGHMRNAAAAIAKAEAHS